MGMDDVHMRKRGFSLAFLTLLLLLNTKYYSCEATNFLIESNSSTFHCNDRLNECPKSEDIGVEFFSESHVIRVVQGALGGIREGTGIPAQHFNECAAGYRYLSENKICCEKIYQTCHK